MHVALEQSSLRDAEAVILIAAVYERTKAKYSARGMRYVHMEVGHAAAVISCTFVMIEDTAKSASIGKLPRGNQRADSGRSVTRQADFQRACCGSGEPADQGSAPPALFFRPATHDAAQSHSSSAWRSAGSEVAAMQRPLRP